MIRIPISPTSIITEGTRSKGVVFLGTISVFQHLGGHAAGKLIGGVIL